MEQKKSGSFFVVILAVLIAVAFGGVVFFAVQQGYGKLKQNQTVEGKESEASGQSQQYVEQTTGEMDLEGFSLDGKVVAASSETESDSEYLCDYSSTRKITADDLAKLKAGTYTDLPSGKSIIRMVVNEMYAKYGYTFKSEEIQNYFNQKSWYQAISNRSDDMDGIHEGMTAIEKANIEFLTANE